MACPSFLKHIFLVEDTNHAEDAAVSLRADSRRLEDFPGLKELGVESVSQLVIGSRATVSPNFCSGPYMLSHRGFSWVYRTYTDTQAAFFSTIVQSQDGHFVETRPATEILVPSRLYSAAPSHGRPLSGLRFATKDIIDIQGLKMSAGSRSYYELSSRARATAPAVNRLLALGAILVGKTKNTQFANGEDPQEWIDYDCPWNPRGEAPITDDGNIILRVIA